MKTAVRAAAGVRLSTVMATHLLQATTPARAAIGNKETIRRRLRRQKRGIQPPEPASLQEIDLPEEFKETGGANPEVFIIHDSGSTAQKCMLVFASDKQLQHLAASERYVSLSIFIVKSYTKTEAYKLYLRVFPIFLPNVIKIDPYKFELYRFKVCAFLETQCTVQLTE